MYWYQNLLVDCVFNIDLVYVNLGMSKIPKVFCKYISASTQLDFANFFI